MSGNRVRSTGFESALLRHARAEILTSPRKRGEVGICALFAQIPGEGVSPQAQTGRKGSKPSHKFRLAEMPPQPDPLPASGEREQRPAPRRDAEAVA
jgi:hypothetical protein